MLNRQKMARICILIVLSVTILTVTGCTYKILGNYDRVIDKTALALQSKIITFLNKMERCAGSVDGQYVNNVYFYEEMKGTLDSLAVRAKNLPLHEKILEQINQLKDLIEKLRAVHEGQPCDGLTKETITPFRTEINALFASIYTSENDLKRDRKITTVDK